MNLLQRALLLFFLVLVGISLVLPTYIDSSQEISKKRQNQNNDPVKDESFFKGISYFTIKNNDEKLHLNAKNLTVNRKTSKTLFFFPEGSSLTKSGKTVNYKAKKGEYIPKEKYLHLVGEVEVKTITSEVRGDEVKFFGNKDKVQCRGNIFSSSKSTKTNDRVEVTAQQVDVDLNRNYSEFEGNVEGRVKRNRAYEQNVKFSSEKMQLDRISNKMYLQDEVVFKKRSVTAFSRSGEIFLENYNKRLKYFVLNDDVRVVEKVKLSGKGPGNNFERRAFSEKLEGLMSEGKIILTGYPKVIQQGDTIKGNLIVLREDIDVIEVVDANTNFKIGN